jgi:hypothetical protein
MSERMEKAKNGKRKMNNGKWKFVNKRMKKSLSLGRGCRDSQQAGAAGEGFHKEFLPSPGPSGHPLPAGEGPQYKLLQSST